METVLMNPSYSINNASDCPLANTKSFCELSLGKHRVKGFYFIRYFLRKFMVPAFFSKATVSTVSSFGNAILNVVHSCPKKKMLWIYTRSVVALMANEYPGGNVSVVNNPRSLMCPNGFSLSSTSLDLPISVIFRSRPNPTFSNVRHMCRAASRFIYFPPKSICEGFRKIGRCFLGRYRMAVIHALKYPRSIHLSTPTAVWKPF